jgi:hypothetical protein
VENHDRKSGAQRSLTWRSSHAFTVLNTKQFLARRLGTDLARRKPGVQIPSPPPPHRTSSGRMGPSGSGALVASLGSRVPSLLPVTRNIRTAYAGDQPVEVMDTISHGEVVMHRFEIKL